MGVSTAPKARGGPQCSPILGFPSIYAHPLMQNYQFWRGNTGGEGVHLGVSHNSHPKSGVPELPNLEGSPVFMPIPFKAERPNSAW